MQQQIASSRDELSKKEQALRSITGKVNSVKIALEKKKRNEQETKTNLPKNEKAKPWSHIVRGINSLHCILNRTEVCMCSAGTFLDHSLNVVLKLAFSF